MNMYEYMANLITNTALSYYEKAVLERTRKLGDRVYGVLKLSEEVRMKLYEEIVEKLSKYSEYGVKIKIIGSRIEFQFQEEMPKFYRVGLYMSEGTKIKNSNTLIFSTSIPETLYCILRAFKTSSIYFEYYFKSFKTGKISPIFNITVKDYEILEYINNVHLLINELNRVLLFKAQFLAGTIDSDGAIDNDSVRISTHPGDKLFEVIRNIIPEEYLRYYSSKYMVRISTVYLRKLELLRLLLHYVLTFKKRKRLEELLRRM